MIERDANLLGYLGILPMAFCAAVVWLTPGVFSIWFTSSLLDWTLSYAAIILAFMGGARWSLAMLAPEKRPEEPLSGLLAAILPAFLAFLVLIPSSFVSAPYSVWFGLLMLGFALLLVEDMRGVRAGQAPSWYGTLRVRLTFWVMLSLAFLVLKLVIGRV